MPEEPPRTRTAAFLRAHGASFGASKLPSATRVPIFEPGRLPGGFGGAGMSGASAAFGCTRMNFATEGTPLLLIRKSM